MSLPSYYMSINNKNHLGTQISPLFNPLLWYICELFKKLLLGFMKETNISSKQNYTSQPDFLAQ
jgi:hypothetical protein